MTQINACCLSPRLAAKHYLKRKEKKKNLQMTTLFRQGVESCLQSKERHRTQVPPAEGSSGEAGARQASWGQGSRKVGSKL